MDGATQRRTGRSGRRRDGFFEGFLALTLLPAFQWAEERLLPSRPAWHNGCLLMALTQPRAGHHSSRCTSRGLHFLSSLFSLWSRLPERRSLAPSASRDLSLQPHLTGRGEQRIPHFPDDSGTTAESSAPKAAPPCSRLSHSWPQLCPSSRISARAPRGNAGGRLERCLLPWSGTPGQERVGTLHPGKSTLDSGTEEGHRREKVELHRPPLAPGTSSGAIVLHNARLQGAPCALAQL